MVGSPFHVAATMPAPVRTSPPVATLGVADGDADLAPPQRPFRHHARRLCRAQMARSREERGGATVREGRPSTALPNGEESLSCCRYHLRRFA